MSVDFTFKKTDRQFFGDWMQNKLPISNYSFWRRRVGNWLDVPDSNVSYALNVNIMQSISPMSKKLPIFD